MDKSEWQEIRSAIYDALDDYDCNVWYYYPTKDGCCGFFCVTINEDDYDVDDIDSCLSGVIFEYDLEWDYDSDDGDFDLNADWDRI